MARLLTEINNLEMKKPNFEKVENPDFTAKIERLQQKRDEYLAVLEELRNSEQGDEQGSYENLPELYELVASKLDEYEENRSILNTLKLLPPDLDLASAELKKLKEEVEILERQKRELLSGRHPI